MPASYGKPGPVWGEGREVGKGGVALEKWQGQRR